MSSTETPHRQKTNRSAMPRLTHIPHVLLLVDTAAPFGRAVIKGVGRYALENGPWSIQFVYRVLDSLPPQWLKAWRGDGIISRTVNLKQARMLWRTKLPLVELHSHPKIGVPQIRVDVLKVGHMAAEHFLNCGLRQFAFFSYGEAWWIRSYREAFGQVLKERGFDCHSYQPPASDPKPALLARKSTSGSEQMAPLFASSHRHFYRGRYPLGISLGHVPGTQYFHARGDGHPWHGK